MYLKKIEIHGFKSFANKIVLDFHDGITAIVGPNGSGKSNVADAVRWVLGEQSAKQLRGGNMQDVIFSGTQIRKPQGFAYVAITLDNSDHAIDIEFEEITVSRRIYRSGESEYMINGSACRLKDISELFFDTGIGKDGYSIIGQGQVDKILSGRADERRELFDEAAGITKYKRRKQLAQKKLENERENLVRVKDILAELSRQVGPLEEQSKVAREYLKLRDELKRYDIAVFVNESDSLRSINKSVEDSETIAREQLETVTKELNTQNQLYEEMERKLLELDAVIDEKKSDMHKSNMSISELEGKIALYKEQINNNIQNSKNIELRLENIKTDTEQKNLDIEEYEVKIREYEASLTDFEKDNRDIEEKLSVYSSKISEKEEAINSRKEEILKNINDKSELLSQNQRVETLIEQLKIRKSETTQRIIDIKSEESLYRQNLITNEAKAKDFNLSLSTKEADILSIEEELKKKEAHIAGLNLSLSKLHNEYQHYSARLDSLKNIAEKYEGYGNSIKRVMESSDRLSGIHGVVAEIIKVDKRYELAIETALGARIQNIVTDTEDTAKTLIEYLKKNKYGRATFIPLTAVKDSKDMGLAQVLKEEGVIGIASKLVSADAMYTPLISNLLGRIIVVSDIEKAVAISKKYRYEYRLVSLEGDLFNPGGSISGGAFKNSSNLLGRKREIEELEKNIEEIERQNELLDKDLDYEKHIFVKLKKEQEELKSEVSELRIEFASISHSIETLNAKIKDNQALSQSHIDEKARLDKEEEELVKEKQKLSAEIEGMESNNSDIESYVQKYQADIDEDRKSRDALLIKQSELKLKFSGIEQSISFSRENIDRIQKELERLREEAMKLVTEQDNNKNLLIARNNDVEHTEDYITKLKGSLLSSEDELKELSNDKQSKLKMQREAFTKRDELSKEVSNLEKEMYRLIAQKERSEARLEELSSYMWQEYELTLSLAKELTAKEEELALPLSEIQKLIVKIKQSIRSLGPVNVHSVEEYKEVSERYELMNTQYEDIITAEASLIDIIEDLDNCMRVQFSEKFVEINEQFDKVFSELFGGGSGRLELEEGIDVLDAGISIISQPPGKKLQNMMQLSGGEKALTAISLLFAIQNLKPSPFALLDEIEAALDDSNVDRFAAYLHKLSDRTQFVVITHRRGTMVSADRLYGITMQEKGISTLVSVNLVEAQLDN